LHLLEINLNNYKTKSQQDVATLTHAVLYSGNIKYFPMLGKSDCAIAQQHFLEKVMFGSAMAKSPHNHNRFT